MRLSKFQLGLIVGIFCSVPAFALAIAQLCLERGLVWVAFKFLRRRPEAVGLGTCFGLPIQLMDVRRGYGVRFFVGRAVTLSGADERFERDASRFVRRSES